VIRALVRERSHDALVEVEQAGSHLQRFLAGDVLLELSPIQHHEFSDGFVVNLHALRVAG
jgi:hypothetical protein